MSNQIDTAALNQIFEDGRTFNYFLDEPVSDDLLRQAANLAELGPTESNSLPGRFLFLTSAEAKARLAPHMSDGNREKTLKAPVNLIAAYDLAFFENLPRTFPHVDARSWYAHKSEDALRFSAARSTALQLGYLIIALRALGLDVGPMGGFEGKGVDETFLAGTSWRSFVVANIGYGDRSRLHPRNPRLSFDEFARIL
jgi:3-hydroxypropanoate dehydrogenase